MVLGVSPDSVESHRKFKTKFDLPFTLVADTDHAIADRYGVWIEKNMYGRTFWGNARTTFLIDPQGRIAHVWEKVTPEEHGEDVAKVLEGLPRK